MSKIVTLIIAVHAKYRELLHIINHEEKEKIDMCESMILYRERTLNESEKIGVLKSLMIMLEQKIGKLSPEVEIIMKKSSHQQLEQLTMKVFDVENEKNILDILH